MPTVIVDPTLEMHYLLDDFTDPWAKPKTVLMVHGIAESSASWYGWVPVLARHYRVIRIDQRGFGLSSLVSEGRALSIKDFTRDIARFLDQLEIAKVHLISAKFGGTIGLQFAHDYPERLYSLTTVGSPARLGGADVTPVPQPRADDPLSRGDVEGWARLNMGNRLGSGASPALVEYWSKFMGSARLNSVRAIVQAARVDLTPLLHQITVPTLMISASRSSMVPLDTAKAWTSALPKGELLVMDSDSYHLAATMPERCAQATLDFLQKVEWHEGTTLKSTPR